jgi:hypothetical protein
MTKIRERSLSKREIKLVEKLAPVLNDILRERNELYKLGEANSGTEAWNCIAKELEPFLSEVRNIPSMSLPSEWPRLVSYIIQESRGLIGGKIARSEKPIDTRDKKTGKTEEIKRAEIATNIYEQRQREKQIAFEQGAAERGREYDLAQAAVGGEISIENFNKLSKDYKQKREPKEQTEAIEEPEEQKEEVKEKKIIPENDLPLFKPR